MGDVVELPVVVVSGDGCVVRWHRDLAEAMKPFVEAPLVACRDGVFTRLALHQLPPGPLRRANLVFETLRCDATVDFSHLATHQRPNEFRPDLVPVIDEGTIMTDQPTGHVGLCPAVTDSIFGSSHNHHLSCTLLASHAGLHRDPSGADWGPATDGFNPSVLPATSVRWHSGAENGPSVTVEWREPPLPGEIAFLVEKLVKLGGEVSRG